MRWFEAHLKGTFDFPKTAKTELILNARPTGELTGIPRFTVRPDLSGPHELKSVAVFYGYDRDPRPRFWRSAEVVREGDSFTAACPVMELGERLGAQDAPRTTLPDPVAPPAVRRLVGEEREVAALDL